MRGRVMSLSLVAFIGLFPFTSYGLGALASAVGTPATFVGCGVVCLVASVTALGWRRDIWIPGAAADRPVWVDEAPLMPDARSPSRVG
jgi:hypothetical protein